MNLSKWLLIAAVSRGETRPGDGRAIKRNRGRIRDVRWVRKKSARTVQPNMASSWILEEVNCLLSGEASVVTSHDDDTVR